MGVLVLSQFVEAHHAMRLLEAGHCRIGYLLKDRVTDVDELVDGVRRVARGGCRDRPRGGLAAPPRTGEVDPLEQLTDREREVLALMSEDVRTRRSTNDCSSVPRPSRPTSAIFDKLGLIPTSDDHRRVLAVVAYLRRK